MSAPRYIVLTPARNEEKFLSVTIESVVTQTIRPHRWIIINDGSTDGTGQIADAAARAHDWIQVLHRPDRGFRQPGGGVVEALNAGYALTMEEPWHFLVKLDGDLSFASNYFERCLLRFSKEPTLGIGGGTICNQVGADLTPEAPDDPAFHVRGATKVYRRECWEAIGGWIPAPGWDTVDEYKANMLGWITYTFPELRLWHHRPAGGAQGTWKNWVKNGLANYIAGYHPIFMISKCVRRAFVKPYGVVALGLLVGFVSGYARRVPQVNDKALIRYLRHQQICRLSLRESLWDRKPAPLV
ncbi:MAG: glycosyltransferase family A protein [Verrucomicrobiota bacterium]